MSAIYSELRDDQLDAVAATAAAADLPVVVAGDLNATGWSPILRRLQRDGGLRLSTRGWVPTWPVGMPVLWVPLDHVLHSAAIGVVRCVRSNDIGSDHYPLVVDLRVMRP